MQNSIHIEEPSIASCSTLLLCQTEFINYTVCSLLLYVFVGDIPLHIDIRETADSGKPIVVSQPDCLQVQCTTPTTAPSKFNWHTKEGNEAKGK